VQKSWVPAREAHEIRRCGRTLGPRRGPQL